MSSQPRLLHRMTTSYHLHTHPTTYAIVSSTTIKATKGYQAILHVTEDTLSVTTTHSFMNIVIYIMIVISTFVILLCLTVVVVKMIRRRSGKLTIDFVNKYPLTGLCYRHRYRPVVDLENEHIELSSDHLLSSKDSVNSLYSQSDSD